MTGRLELVVEVIEALADDDRLSPTALEYTLYDHVDPEVPVALAVLENDR